MQPWNFSEKCIKNSVGRGHCHIATGGDFDTLWVIKTLVLILAILISWDAYPLFFWWCSLKPPIANFRPSAFLGAKSQLVKYVICAFHCFYVQMHIHELCSSWEKFWTFREKCKIQSYVLLYQVQCFKNQNSRNWFYNYLSKNSKYLQTWNTVQYCSNIDTGKMISSKRTSFGNWSVVHFGKCNFGSIHKQCQCWSICQS